MEQEYGVCDICGAQDYVSRTYFYYHIDCDCCKGPENHNHHEIVYTCPRCVAVPPKTLRVKMQPFDWRDTVTYVKE